MSSPISGNVSKEFDVNKPSTSIYTSTTTPGGGSVKKLGDQDTFLKLLVAQLKYQDPSKPADSTAFLAQTAQFTQVEKLGADRRHAQAQQLIGASALVGRTVTYQDADGMTPVPASSPRPSSTETANRRSWSGTRMCRCPRSRKSSNRPATTPAAPPRSPPPRRPVHLHDPLPRRTLMLRSLFSGISGLRAHQQMMDVTGNNIANVNTTGYKSSQAVFQDTLSQMVNAAGAPQNGAGGTNPAQVGLGVRTGQHQRELRPGRRADHRQGRRHDDPGRRLLRRQERRRGALHPGRLVHLRRQRLADHPERPDRAGLERRRDGVVNTAGAPGNIKLPIGISLSPTVDRERHPDRQLLQRGRRSATSAKDDPDQGVRRQGRRTPTSMLTTLPTKTDADRPGR